MRTCLVTITIGDFHEKMSEITHPTLKSYAEKIGSDFVVLKDSGLYQTPHYKKLEIKDLFTYYDRVLYVDTDIVIREDSPNIFNLVPYDSIGLFEEGRFTDRATGFRQFLSKQMGIDHLTWDGKYYNTGVIVLSKCHADILKDTLVEYAHFYEQSYINYLIHVNKPNVFILPHSFNRMECMDRITGEQRYGSYFMHYAGAASAMNESQILRMIKNDLTVWRTNSPKHEYKRLTPIELVQMPAADIPNYRIERAIKNGVQNNLLIYVGGGIGDHVCAEPVVRYAVNNFKECNVSVIAHFPAVFKNMKGVERVFDIDTEMPDFDNYLMVSTLTAPEHFSWQFYNHFLMQPVDFMSISAFRMQLPLADREIKLTGEKPELDFELTKKHVIVHPGKSWEAKTFPKQWWDQVLDDLVSGGAIPIIIGSYVDWRSTVEVDTTGCIDLRDKTTLLETTWLLQSCSVLLTNDSSPLHMAASGSAWIGLVTICKHPDNLMHYRRGKLGWRMSNFSNGGLWQIINTCPNQSETVVADKIPDGLMEEWLPNPTEFADWAISKTL